MSAARPTPIRLLVVDDHEVVRVGLRTLLHHHGMIIVGEAGTKAAAVRAVTRLKPDLVLMDVRLPDGSGVEAAREILARHPATRLLFLTSYPDEESTLAAVLAGAQGYVLKTIDTDLLIQSIRTVCNGQSILDPALTQRARNWLNAGSAHAGPVRTTLAPQEERILALVADGLTNKAIAAAMHLSDKTVKNYLANMFRKLHISRRTQAATFFVKRQA
jgi:DNA-binding NarL/FixJ family response regulator